LGTNPRTGQGQLPWIAYSLRDILTARAEQSRRRLSRMSDRRPQLPAAAPAASAAASGRPAATRSAARTGRRRGGRDAAGERRPDRAGEAAGVGPGVARARIPAKGLAIAPRGIGRGSGQHFGELVGPAVLDLERDGVGKEAFEQFRSLLWRVERLEPFFLSDRQVVLEAFDTVHDLATFPGRRGSPDERRDHHRQRDQRSELPAPARKRHGLRQKRDRPNQQPETAEHAEPAEREQRPARRAAPEMRNGYQREPQARRRNQPLERCHVEVRPGDNRADEQHCREQHEQPYPGPREVPQEQLALVVTLQMLLERLGGGAEPGMVGVVHLDALAAAEQRIEHGPLAGLQAAAAVGPEEGGLRASETEERLLALDQLELAVGAAFDD